MRETYTRRLRQLTLALLASGASAAALAAGGVPAKPIPAGYQVEPGETRAVELPAVLRDLRGTKADDKTNAPYIGPYAAATGRPGFPVSAAELARDPKLKVSDFRLRSTDRAALARLIEKAARGPVDAIVTLKMTMTPEGLLSDAATNAQRSQIARLQQNVISALAGREHRVLHRYQYVPQLSLKLDAKALELLSLLPDVADIQEVELSAPDLADSAPLVGSADLLDRGVGGAGWVVAVLDTGIDLNHPFLRAYVAESCFSGNGNCPNGTARQSGAGSAAACTYAPGCDHGTHVAGIATGASQAGFTSLEGIARSARVMPVQVFTRFTGSDCSALGKSSPCTLSRTDDQVAALEYVYSQRFNYSIAAVNMSLGGGRNTGFCDSDSRKPAIDNLRAAGIATVIASGNNGYTDSVSTPGCISSAVVIGATNKDDTVASYSNSVDYLDMLAPGSDITSSVPTNAFGIKSGTSMATPHVAGAFALLQSQQNRSVSETRALLLNTGKPITDTRAGAGNRVKRRIDVLAAANLNNVTLTDFVPREYRQPRPIPHGFNYNANRSYWSAVAVRPDNAALDVDLQLFDSGVGTGLLATSAAGAGAIDVIAQDNNISRRPQGVDYPQASIFGNGTGRYRIETSIPGRVLNGQLDDVMDGTHVLRIYDAPVTAGVPQYIRVVPTGFNDLELLAFTSTPDSSTWVRGRAAAAAISSAGGSGAAESISFTPPATGFAGIVVTNKIGGFGGYTVYSDRTAPTGSVSINNGATSTATTSVTLTLSAADGETGILDMRVATDGVVDSEGWEPYATSKNVTLSDAPGTKTVAVQFRNRAGQAADPVTDTIELTAPLRAFSINDARLTEGNAGTSLMTFTVRLSEAAASEVSVGYATANGTATAGSDYVATSGRLSFAAGQLTRTVSVTINGDTTVEPDETLFVNLSSPTGATIADAQGIGTIANDDAAAGVPGITVQTRSYNFGNVRVGTSSPERSLVITSSGTAPLAITGIRLTGDYAGTSNCPRSLAPGATCALTGTFRPTATGARPGSVTITSNAPDSPTVINLSGNGT